MKKPKSRFDQTQLYRHPDLGLPAPSAAAAPAAQRPRPIKEDAVVKRQITTDSVASIADDVDEYDDMNFLTEEDLCMLNVVMPRDESEGASTNLQGGIAQQRNPDAKISSGASGYNSTNPTEPLPLKIEGQRPPISRPPIQNNPNQPPNGPRNPNHVMTNAPSNGPAGNLPNASANRNLNGAQTSIHAPARQSMPPGRPGEFQRGPQSNASPQNIQRNGPSNQVQTGRPNPQQQPASASGVHIQRYPAVNHALNQSMHSPANVQSNQPQRPIQNVNPPMGAPVGFVSGRGVKDFAKGDQVGTVPAGVPAFDPKAPFKGKLTEGVSHSTSAPILRQVVGQTPPTINTPAAINKPSNPSVSAHPQQAMGRPTGGSNFVNPQTDANRRIGMPQQAGQSPMTANRTAYKPPGPAVGAAAVAGANAGVKRGADGMVRSPLTEVSNGQGAVSPADHNAKRQRIDAGENGDKAAT
jgi:hypothetical protein